MSETRCARLSRLAHRAEHAWERQPRSRARYERWSRLSRAAGEACGEAVPPWDEPLRDVPAADDVAGGAPWDEVTS